MVNLSYLEARRNGQRELATSWRRPSLFVGGLVQTIEVPAAPKDPD